MYYTDQWAAILDSFFKSYASRTYRSSWWEELQGSGNWKDYIPTGRGQGTYPKPPFHTFRGHMYKYNPSGSGPRHHRLFHAKTVNHCERCERSHGKNVLMPLDYLAFYRTGEVFTWVDPIFLAGELRVDPRVCYPSQDSPLTTMWICSRCWTTLNARAHDRFKENAVRWKMYPLMVKPDGKSRVLIERRVHDSRWSIDPHAPDRRVMSRRSDEVTHLIIPPSVQVHEQELELM